MLCQRRGRLLISPMLLGWSRCVVPATKTCSREVVVFIDLRSHEALDLRIVVDAVAESMPSVYHGAKIRITVMLK